MARRTQSLDRGARAPTDDLLGRLTDILEGIRVEQRAGPRDTFKAPQYRGEGDVEYFIQQFTQVATANGWTELATLLHLRESLQDGARECGRADTIQGVFNILRARYGLTVREARNRLGCIKRNNRCPLQEHATEVERLVRVAYQELPEHIRANMLLDTFCSSLNHAGLQRHLLAVQPLTLEAAVQSGNEYLQVQTDGRTNSGPAIRVMGEEDDSVAAVEPNTLTLLMQAIEKLTAKVDQLELAKQRPKKSSATEAKCWGCGQVGHIRSKCTTQPWPRQAPSNTSGNETSPQ